jgi:branched-chain amino acid transport system substrate-binding protein
MVRNLKLLISTLASSLAALFLLLAPFVANAADAPPIKIGFGMALTGPLAGGGKSALLALQMWAEDVNGRGGILGRPVQLIHYDDQSNPSTVPSIYTKLLDIDKVDLVISGYATNQIAAAMPVIIPRGLLFFSLLGTAVNDNFKYDRYFQLNPNGPDSKDANSTGFFAAAMTMNPKPTTVALVGASAEFSQNSLEGARKNAEKYGLKIVFDRSYPPTTTDYSTIVRSIAATNPDIVYVASYPLDTVGMIRAAREINLQTKAFGGAMIGLQFAGIKAQLGPLLNGVIGYDIYLPAQAGKFPGVEQFLDRYTVRARTEGIDVLGHLLAPYAYAEMQMIEQSLKAVGSIDQKKLGEYAHKTEFDTIIGKIKFGPLGEWDKPRILFDQYQNVVGNDVEQFRKPGRQIILHPPEFKSGDLIYPFAKAQSN